MRIFIIVSLALLLSCSSTNSVRTAELSVDYEGQTVLRSGGFYKDERFLNQALKNETKAHRVVFSQSGCPPCDKLISFLREEGLMSRVIIINANDLWVKQLSAMIGVTQTPTMIVVEEGKDDLVFEGIGQIVTHLIRL